MKYVTKFGHIYRFLNAMNPQKHKLHKCLNFVLMGQIKMRVHVFSTDMVSIFVDTQLQQLHCEITRTNHKLPLWSLEKLRSTELHETSSPLS